MNEQPKEGLECPCCGEVGAEPLYYEDGMGWYEDGQKLICGCLGQVSCDGEGEAEISVFECDCQERIAP